jgi:hypothetical protein
VEGYHLALRYLAAQAHGPSVTEATPPDNDVPDEPAE